MGAEHSKTAAAPKKGWDAAASPPSATERLVDRILTVAEQLLVPLAREAARGGRDVQTCAVLSKYDLSLVVMGSNCEAFNPIFGPELESIVRFFIEDERPEPGDCYVVCTHEPGLVAMAALAQAGFDNFYFIFDAYRKYGKGVAGPGARPGDERMMAELFGAVHGRYAVDNAFWSAFDVKRMIGEHCGGGRRRGFMARVGRLARAHEAIRAASARAG